MTTIPGKSLATLIYLDEEEEVEIRVSNGGHYWKIWTVTLPDREGEQEKDPRRLDASNVAVGSLSMGHVVVDDRVNSVVTAAMKRDQLAQQESAPNYDDLDWPK